MTNPAPAQLKSIEKIEREYRKAAKLAITAEPPNLSAHITAIKGLERCLILKLKFNLLTPLAHPNAESQLATVDLEKLSDSALEELEAALVPLNNSDPRPSTAHDTPPCPETTPKTKRPTQKRPAKTESQKTKSRSSN